MELLSVPVAIPEGANIIIGQSHFIKTVEDLYEVMVTSVPQASFGLAFNEASGDCLIRTDGNDPALVQRPRRRCALASAPGHVFVLFMKNAYPINVLNRIKDCPEVCHVFCATANPLTVIVAQGAEGRGILGVIDGASPKGVEDESGREWRRTFLRKIGYKR